MKVYKRLYEFEDKEVKACDKCGFKYPGDIG